MKTLSLTVAAMLTGLNIHAQGCINFSNIGLNAPVANSLTGDKVIAGTTFAVALYWAPDGVTDESLFAKFNPTVGFVSPGLFDGGHLPLLAVPLSGLVLFQVRAFETAYGSSYENDLAAPAQNGRQALVGKSNVVPIDTAMPTLPPGGCYSLTGLQGFALTIVPEPSTVSLGILGAGISFFFRARNRSNRGGRSFSRTLG